MEVINVLTRNQSANKKDKQKMKNFTIDTETNAITFHASAADAEAVANAERFASEDKLAKLAAEWPMARLVEVWNSLPGQTPVKKFKDRATAVSRIWKAIQHVGAAPAGGEIEPVAVDTPVPPQTPDVAPEPAAAKNRATRTKKAPAAKKKPATADATAPREGSKASQVIAMLKREGGTTLEEIMAKMGWQQHTTRALLSAGGSLTKKHGLIVISEKVGEKRVYSIKG